MMNRLFLILLLSLGLLGLNGCGEPPYTNIDNVRLKDLIAQGVPVYDIRRPEEWRETGIVAGSKMLTSFDASGRLKSDFMPRFTAEAAKDKPVILICRTGSRTDALARELVERMGYTQVFNVRHGITRWISEGQPVTKN